MPCSQREPLQQPCTQMGAAYCRQVGESLWACKGHAVSYSDASPPQKIPPLCDSDSAPCVHPMIVCTHMSTLYSNLATPPQKGIPSPKRKYRTGNGWEMLHVRRPSHHPSSCTCSCMPPTCVVCPSSPPPLFPFLVVVECCIILAHTLVLLR